MHFLKCKGLVILKSHVDVVGLQQHLSSQPPRNVIMIFLAGPRDGIVVAPVTQLKRTCNSLFVMESMTAENDKKHHFLFPSLAVNHCKLLQTHQGMLV